MPDLVLSLQSIPIKLESLNILFAWLNSFYQDSLPNPLAEPHFGNIGKGNYSWLVTTNSLLVALPAGS